MPLTVRALSFTGRRSRRQAEPPSIAEPNVDSRERGERPEGQHEDEQQPEAEPAAAPRSPRSPLAEEDDSISGAPQEDLSWATLETALEVACSQSLATWIRDPENEDGKTKLIVSLLSTLNAERARSKALKVQLERSQKELIVLRCGVRDLLLEEYAANGKTSSSDSATAEASSSAAAAVPAPPPNPLKRTASWSRRALKRVTSTNSSSSKVAGAAKPRSRVAVGPMFAGALVESSQAAALAAIAADLDNIVAPPQHYTDPNAQLMPSAALWPEPRRSAPPRRKGIAATTDVSDAGGETAAGGGGGGRGGVEARSAGGGEAEESPAPPALLSAGLSSHAFLALGDELHRLQEKLSSLLASGTHLEPPPFGTDEYKEYARSVRSLSRRLGWLRSDLSVIAPMGSEAGLRASGVVLPAKMRTKQKKRGAADHIAEAGGESLPDEYLDVGEEVAVEEGVHGKGREEEVVVQKEEAGGESDTRSFDLLLTLASCTEEFVGGLMKGVEGQERIEAEREHVESLCLKGGWERSEVPADGDSLFACAAEWLARLTEQRKERQLRAQLASPGGQKEGEQEEQEEEEQQQHEEVGGEGADGARGRPRDRPDPPMRSSRGAGPTLRDLWKAHSEGDDEDEDEEAGNAAAGEDEDAMMAQRATSTDRGGELIPVVSKGTAGGRAGGANLGDGGVEDEDRDDEGGGGVKEQEEEEEEEDLPEDAAGAIAQLVSSAFDVRQLVVDLMREKCNGAEVNVEVVEDVNEALGVGGQRVGGLDQALARRMVAIVQEAVQGEATDVTSSALRAAMRQRKASQRVAATAAACQSSMTAALQPLDPASPSSAANVQAGGMATASAAAKAAALESYLEVMGRGGVHANRIELEALASLLNVPVQLFYHTGSKLSRHKVINDEDSSEDDEPVIIASEPNEVLVPVGAEPTAEPLRLLQRHDGHFELLLPVA